MIPTFRPWTHTSDDSYIYLAVARCSDSSCIFFPYSIAPIGDIKKSEKSRYWSFRANYMPIESYIAVTYRDIFVIGGTHA